MAKAYREGPSWSFRLRIRSLDIYRSGFATEAAANKAMATEKDAVGRAGKAAKRGPYQTTVGVAFLDYCHERLPYLKGADKDANRINRYLRASNLPTIHLNKIDARSPQSVCYWTVTEQQLVARVIPQSLQAHRAGQQSKRVRTDIERGRLARMKFSEVTPYDVQQLIDAMGDDHYAPATIALERAELRRLFTHGLDTWSWSAPAKNPAGSRIVMPQPDAPRERVLTNAELKAMSLSLAQSGNRYVVPLVCLMLETAMRSCEPLTYANWGDVQWARKILRLPDAKAGRRDVPLNPAAMVLLANMRLMAGSPAADTPIFPTTYEAVKKAWVVARKEAGLDDVCLHDLRHTAATRYSIEYKGNLPILKLITGHKTVSQLMRYINLKADDVVRLMHNEELAIDDAPAGYQVDLMALIQKSAAADALAQLAPSSVLWGDFGARRVA